MRISEEDKLESKIGESKILEVEDKKTGKKAQYDLFAKKFKGHIIDQCVFIEYNIHWFYNK